MHKRTKATSINRQVKEQVWERDHQRCIICGDGRAEPNSHLVRRSQGGLGVVRNIVSMCLLCHTKYDMRTDPSIRMKAMAYIKGHYPDWTEGQVTYCKWRD